MSHEFPKTIFKYHRLQSPQDIVTFMNTFLSVCTKKDDFLIVLGVSFNYKAMTEFWKLNSKKFLNKVYI
jgi:hypothetical protein